MAQLRHVPGPDLSIRSIQWTEPTYSIPVKRVGGTVIPSALAVLMYTCAGRFPAFPLENADVAGVFPALGNRSGPGQPIGALRPAGVYEMGSRRLPR